MEGGVTFWIYDDKGREVTSIGAEIKGNKAEVEWTYHWDGTPLKEKPKFKFKVTGNRCKKVESGEVEISAKIKIVILPALGDLPEKVKYYLEGPDNSEEISLDDENSFEKEDLIPGTYKISLERQK
jgi:hypothetical protein